MKGFMRFVSGLILGGMVGSTLALLFAPSSGNELVGDVQDRVTRIQDEVKLAAETRRMELEQQLALLRAPRKTGE